MQSSQQHCPRQYSESHRRIVFPRRKCRIVFPRRKYSQHAALQKRPVRRGAGQCRLGPIQALILRLLPLRGFLFCGARKSPDLIARRFGFSGAPNSVWPDANLLASCSFFGLRVSSHEALYDRAETPSPCERPDNHICSLQSLNPRSPTYAAALEGDEASKTGKGLDHPPATA